MGEKFVNPTATTDEAETQRLLFSLEALIEVLHFMMINVVLVTIDENVLNNTSVRHPAFKLIIIVWSREQSMFSVH
jgi:hypothetical protein